MSRDTGPSKAVRNQLRQRDQDACCFCSQTRCGARLIPHHRKPRGRGGDNRLSNLILVGDVGGCHDLIVESRRAESNLSGWLVSTGHDPAETPVIWHGVLVLLDDEGGVTPVEVAA